MTALGLYSFFKLIVCIKFYNHYHVTCFVTFLEFLKEFLPLSWVANTNAVMIIAHTLPQ